MGAVAITRRDLFKMAAAIGVAATFARFKADIVETLALAIKRGHVMWIHGANCTGCTYAFVSTIPELEDVLTDLLTNDESTGPVFLPYFLSTLNPLWGGGRVDAFGKAISAWKAADRTKGPTVLITEGAVPLKFSGATCKVGPYNYFDLLLDLAPYADVILAIGSCASFGGVPHASPNPTGCTDTYTFLELFSPADAGKVIRLPRCPAHPESVALTVAALLAGQTPQLDAHRRPLAFYEEFEGLRPRTIHDHCPRVWYYARRMWAWKPSDRGCVFLLGCKGPYTNADCTIRKWNRGTSVCTEVGAPCLGCAQPDWPDPFTPFWLRMR